jgi:endonuclease YncB( thermonuclease family)
LPASCFFSNIASAKPVRYQGRLVVVADWKTISVLDGHKTLQKVRLMGIYAPEKSQAFGDVSRQHLAARVFS